MNTTNRIIDTIDTLVDDQLAEGPHDDYNVNRYDKCGHCGRDWHGLRITTRIEHMRIRGVYDENYRTDTDTSPVLCEGSAFIGPQSLPDRIAPPIGLNPWQRAEYLRWLAAYNQTPIHRAQRLMRNMLDSLAAIMGMTPLTIDPPAGNPETSE